MIYVLLLIRDAQRPSERAELWASCLCNSRPRLYAAHWLRILRGG